MLIVMISLRYVLVLQ